jgi:hypothetical protein
MIDYFGYCYKVSFAGAGIPLSFISKGTAGGEKHKYRKMKFAGKHHVRILRKQW